ncbi:hypothetical protein [Sphingomonas immobilis]|uniref:Uncharacterized protein n=1 Tax=Sphingomonas immobilis TaxID=3063997 RepID=A0ABT9A0W1_9SPHN|nr:hypothetical protein [Sphingomonas sp. CA1-15]MDO7843459.1 hypothetical protein [Sphingomonas sp. CA1-15]
MSELDALLSDALRAARPVLFGSVEINLPGHDLLLLDGSAELMVDGRKFVGRDPAYGVLDSIKGLSDSMDDQAPMLTIGLIAANTTALATLIDPAVQGSPTKVSMGCVDMATGLSVGTPYLLFSGELDVPTVSWNDHDRRLEYKAISIVDRLFTVEEGRRLSNAFHQYVWPGELGCAFVTNVETWVPWGQKLNTASVETRTNLPGYGNITTART